VRVRLWAAKKRVGVGWGCNSNKQHIEVRISNIKYKKLPPRAYHRVVHTEEQREHGPVTALGRGVLGLDTGGPIGVHLHSLQSLYSCRDSLREWMWDNLPPSQALDE